MNSSVVIDSVIIGGGEVEHQQLELKDQQRVEEQQQQQHHISPNEPIVVDEQFSTATTSSSSAAALLTTNVVKSYPPLEDEQITALSSSDVVLQHHLEDNSAVSSSLPLNPEGSNNDFKLFPAVLHSASFSIPSSENSINKAAQLTFLQVPLFDGKEDADLIDTDYTGDNIVGYFKGHTHHAIGDKNKLTEMYGKVFFVRELSLSNASNAGESFVCIIWSCDEYDAACFVERLTLQEYEGFFNER
jgi:hypothetical protein